MPEMKRPLVYDETHQEHLPIEEGQAVSPAYIPVDTSVPNALQVGEEGLKVSADALVSDAADNQLKSQDGKLYVAPVAAPEAEAADLVSDAEDNQLKVQDNKLYVAPLKAPEADAEALVSDAEDNRLVVQDNRLYVAPVEVPDPAPGELVSADEGNLLGVGLDGKLAVKAENLPKQSVVSTDEANILREGTDGGAYLDGNDLLSNGDINLLTISEIDHKIQLTRKNVLENMTVVSEDEGNLIGVGSDGGVYMGKDELISEEDDVLTVDSHGKLVTELGMKYNTVTGELTLTGVDGEEVGSAIVPTSTSALRGVQFVRSMPSETGEAVEGDYFVDIAFKFDSQDAWDGGDAVKFTTTKGTAATQNVDYEMQSTVGTGVFPDHFKAVFMGKAVEQDITAGSPNTVDFPDGSRLILTWNTSTGTAINFQASFTPGIGIELGSFLRMAWLLADGSVSDVYIEMTDIYTAGNGIHIDDTGLVSVVVSSTGGLQNGPDGVGVKVDPDGGLQTSEEGTSIKVDPTGGLETSEEGTSIKVDSTGGLQTNENGTSIKVDPEGGLQTGENGTSIKTDPASGLVTGPNGTGIDDTWLDNQVTDQIRNTELVTAGNGIQVDTTETGKQVAVVGSDSINSEADGISVDETWLATQITDKVKEDTTLVTADDSINVTPTDTGVQVAVDTTWLDQQITDQIKNDETLLVKGNGITLTATATGREIAADAGTGVVVDTNGINVDLTWLNNRITDKVKEDTTLVTGGPGITTTPTETGTQIDVNEDWLADQITEQVRTDTGLIQAGNGIAINVTDDGKTISANAGTGIVADTDGISVNEEWLAQQVTDKVIEDTSLVTAGNGVNVTPTGTGVQVAVVGSDSVTSGADGISVNEEWLATQITDKVKGDTTLVTADDSINVTPTGTGVQVAVDEAWLNEQVSNRVESGGLVTAGDGIDVTASEGKAEVAVDDTVVRTSGNQHIDGTKTFNDTIFMDGAASQGVYKVFPDVTKGTPPAATVYTSLLGLDKNGATAASEQENRLVMLEMGITPTSTLANLYAYKNEAGTTTRAVLGVVYPNDGDAYATAPTTPAAASGNEIVTVNYLKGANSGVVHLAGEETITGNKTFSGGTSFFQDVMIVGDGGGDSSPEVDLTFATNWNEGEAPAVNRSGGMTVHQGPANTSRSISNLIFNYTTAGEASVSMRTRRVVDTDNTFYELKVVAPQTGDPYAIAPSTRTTPVDNEIVTVDFLSKAESNLVHRTGDETIGGNKSFTGLTTLRADLQLKQDSDTNITPHIDTIVDIERGDTLTDDVSFGMNLGTSAMSGENIFMSYNGYIDASSNEVIIGANAKKFVSGGDTTTYYLNLHVPATGDAYATAPSTRTTPSANEIITYDFLQQYVEANGGGSVEAYVPILGTFYNHNTSPNRYALAFNTPSGGTWWCNGGTIKFSSNTGDGNITLTFCVGTYAGNSMIYTTGSGTSPYLNYITGIVSNNVVVFKIA